MNVNFISFGCKVNQYETECIKQTFINNGYNISNSISDSEIFIVNSCTVTASSDSKAIQCIKRIRKDKPDSVIALTGCYPQASMNEAEEITEADIITGTQNRLELLSLVEQVLKTHEKTVEITPYNGNELIENMTCIEFTEKTRAFVKIQDGCNQFCSYCIIPYARGRIRSKPIDALKQEIKILAEHGHKEIVLVGINLAFYGKEYGLRLVDAVEACSQINEIKRIRLSSLEPEMILHDDISRLSKISQFCPHFHLSLQSGCDKTLKEMNRQYTSEEYLNLVKKIKSVFHDCSITTDIMVGFPNESDDDFKQSITFAEKIGFSKIHVFPYSKRIGTVAAKRENQIPEHIKIKRAKEMAAISNASAQNFLNSQVGKVYPVLFEKENCTKFHQGHCPNYTLVRIPSKTDEKSLRHKIFYVKIIGYEKNYCIGEIIY